MAQILQLYQQAATFTVSKRCYCKPKTASTKNDVTYDAQFRQRFQSLIQSFKQPKHYENKETGKKLTSH